MLLALMISPAPLAAPGAHGPDGEHLDTPAAAAQAGAAPGAEAHSEQFELVARLLRGELSILIDRYDSNEPVLDASVEIESGGLRAAATLHADQGDYSVTDEKLLAALARPGEHALLFTIVTPQDSDLLDATLRVADPAGSDATHDEHNHGPDTLSLLGWVVVAAAALAVGALLLRSRSSKGSLQ
ncbi:MAG: hypothetical protein B7Z52_02345 [Burkholderiales bacterium 12-64-5]|nr:MAG: hypothetical protein B7Z52_02345 [Burkholderiales bacterium 12-64-5]